LLAAVCLVALGAPAVSSAATSPPQITSAFGPTSIAVGGTSSLSVTITNPNSSASLSGISFTDTLPGGVVVDNPNGQSGTCGSSSAVTASPGSDTFSLSTGGLSAGASCTISVNVTSSTAGVYPNSTGVVSSSNGGNGNSDTESLTVVGPPTITVHTPRNHAVYNFGQRVPTSFACQEATNGPGLSGCSGTVDDTGDELSSGRPLPTSIAGPHTFTVTAASSDGQLVSDTVNYTVKPDNRFTISHVKGSPSGLVSLQAKLPGAGKLKVGEFDGHTTFGSRSVAVNSAGKLNVTVPPSARGAALIGAKPAKLVIRLVVTYTPHGGAARKLTVSGVRIV
jgi:hypothetical protein